MGNQHQHANNRRSSSRSPLMPYLERSGPPVMAITASATAALPVNAPDLRSVLPPRQQIPPSSSVLSSAAPVSLKRPRSVLQAITLGPSFNTQLMGASLWTISVMLMLCLCVRRFPKYLQILWIAQLYPQKKKSVRKKKNKK